MSSLQQGELIEEAVERAGIDAASLTHRHITSINRSLLLLFTELERELDAEYRMVETTIAIALAAKAVTLPADCIDVTDVMVITSGGEELPVRRISRQDYLNINRSPSGNPVGGTPSGFWVSKSTPGEVGRLPGSPSASDDLLLVVWPAMGQAGASLRVSYIRQITDPTTLGATVDARREYLEAMCRGLAAKVALKYNEAKFDKLEALYRDYLIDLNQDRHPVVIGFRGHGWARSRRH